MKKLRLWLFVLTALGACSTPMSPEIKKNLYEVEFGARRMNSQHDMALLYVVDSLSAPHTGLNTKLWINGEAVMDGELYEKFNVFCLSPGEYTLTFEGDLFVPNKQEFVTLKAGDVHVRAFDQLIGSIAFIPLAASEISKIPLDQAKDIVAVSRIGSDNLYQNSRYRCRSIEG